MPQSTPAPRRVVFQYLVSVHVEVEDGLVACVTVLDETPVRNPTVAEGDPAYLGARYVQPTTAKPSPPGSSATSPRPFCDPSQARPSAGLFSFLEPPMTDFLTRFSCLRDVGTAANAVRAFDIYSALMAANAREDPPAEPFLLSLTPQHGPARLWLHDPGSADQQLAITFVTRCAKAFGLTGRWGFQWATIASDPVVDGFYGGAHVLELSTGATIEWISTGRWLADRLAQGDAR